MKKKTYKHEFIFTLADLVKYPFTRDAIVFVRKLGFEVNDLKTAFGQAVSNRSMERIIASLKKENEYIPSDNLELEILSFPVSLIMLKLIDDDMLTRKYAVFESKRIGELLLEEEPAKVLYIAKKTFNWDIKIVTGGSHRYPWAIHFTDYISNVPEYSPKWKLVNRLIIKGYVLVTREEVIRLIEERVKKLIVERVKNMEIAPDLSSTLGSQLKRILEAWLPQKTKALISVKGLAVKESDYPPCMRILMEKAKKGENLSHAERFALATFLLSLGKSVDEVVNVFSTMPDFNESRTRYQVEHLAGLRGSRKKYSPFNCENMRTYGLCYADEVCKGIKHPLQYFFKRAKRRDVNVA
ncbi:MAG: DNA primase large subunit PriL [Thermoproteales archaeon]|nr:DNA primase large subunit PriL [Thermoproteales archaeon]